MRAENRDLQTQLLTDIATIIYFCNLSKIYAKGGHKMVVYLNNNPERLVNFFLCNF